MPERARFLAREAIAQRVFPGCVIGILKGGRTIVESFGRLMYDADAPPVTRDTAYDLASVTKSIPTASLALSLLAEGALSLADPVARFVPEMRNHFGATIGDLLRYRVRGSRMSSLRYRTFEEIRTCILEGGFAGPPGGSVYTNLPAYVLGVIVERAAGSSLAALAERRFFSPLGMTATTFFPASSDCAPTEIDERGEMRGLPHDESAYVFARARRSAGHAGLFSTAGDALLFFEALLRGGMPAVAKGAQDGLGWQVRDPYFMGSRVGPCAFGKTGFTGTSVLCDIERGIALVILSNRTYPKRPADAFSRSSATNRFRAAVADAVFG